MQSISSTLSLSLSSPVATLRKMDINRDHQRKNASRFETLGSRNLVEQVKSARAKVDMYFGKVRDFLMLQSWPAYYAST